MKGNIYLELVYKIIKHKINNIYVVGNAQIIVYSTYYLNHTFLF